MKNPIVLEPGSPEARRSLAAALAYRNRHVVDRFLGEYPLSRAEGEDVFRETKRWMWLCAKSGHSGALSVTPSMMVIDEMWHAFILFTVDYASYCDKHMGRMIHHVPTTHTESARFFKRLRASLGLYYFETGSLEAAADQFQDIFLVVGDED